MADPRAKPQWRSAVDLPLIVLATATVLSLIRSIDQPSFTVDVAGGVLVAFTVVAVGYGLLAFFDAPFVESRFPGRRQPSFLGEHDLAALSTMTLAVALAALFAPRHRLGRLPLVAGIAGGIGVVLGAAVAGLLGLYLAVGAILAVGAARKAATKRAVVITLAVTAAITIGVLSLRSGDLGAFLRSVGIGEKREGTFGNAASWNERLIDAYIGGRIFLDNPVVGTGWHGELPPEEFVRFLDDARARFPDQPATYFPSEDVFIPQQTYDQVLYELGIVGALLFLVFAFVTVRTAVRVALTWPRGDPDEAAAYLPAAWVAALAGGLSGAALFGGIPLAAIFWITIGVTAVAPSLAPPPAHAEPS